jgi:membrane-associated HD superfamily phosphohydrolase
VSEYRSLALTVIAIFIITLLAAYFSPSFAEQKTYLELFILFGSLLFIFAVVIIFATLGFHSFALFLSLFLAVVIVMYGVMGALLITAVTYFLWGSIFAMEVLLFYNGSESAKAWFVSRYDFKTFKMEYFAFYPLMGMLYILLEFIPYLFSKERLVKFTPSKVLKEMEELLS